MDALLSGLFGEQHTADRPHHRARAEVFVSRYEQGAPWDDIADAEALHSCQATAGRLSPEDLEDSAAETYAPLARGAAPRRKRRRTIVSPQLNDSHRQ